MRFREMCGQAPVVRTLEDSSSPCARRRNRAVIWNALVSLALGVALFSTTRGAEQTFSVAQAEDDSAAPAASAVFEVPAGAVFEHVVVGVDGAAAIAGAESERLIYSNTLGTAVVAFPADALVSDDLSTTARNGCNLTRFRFKVVGKANPTDSGGPYTVRYALYNNCPQAASTTERSHYTDEPSPNTGIKIRGADGELTFPDDAPRTIEHVIAAPIVVPIPTNLWLGMSFTRANCGSVVGAPAMVGFSADVFDFPGFHCSSNMGGFPDSPHASFWAEVYGGENCPTSYVGYQAAMAAGPKFSAGPSVWFADDIRLITHGCNMIGYEVAARGQGYYNFELRESCAGAAISGTQRAFFITLNTRPQLQLARFAFDPPIPIPESLWIAFRVNNNTAGGVVLAGIQPSIGSSSQDYFQLDQSGRCEPHYPGPPSLGTYHVSITCDGEPPVGACCDMYLTDESGGAVCRDVPQVNCPGAPPGADQAPDPSRQQHWIEAAICNTSPFPHPCGVSACCKPDDSCENLTKAECNAVPPLDKPRFWERGEFCHEGEQACPFNACLAHKGPCTIHHASPGCSDSTCCTAVCTFDDWCCHVEWDDLCVRWSDTFCRILPDNDACWSRTGGDAAPIALNSSGVYTNLQASQETTDPGICCHGGVGVCVGGSHDSSPCISPDDCPDGSCALDGPTPGAKGYGTIWFKFVASGASARISTCGSKEIDPKATDSLLEVFAVGDPRSNSSSCDSLISVGCNDDAGDACPGEPDNSEVCVTGLVPGDTYYVMLASKIPRTQGRYLISLTDGCDPSPDIAPNDWCPNALDITDGVTPFYINMPDGEGRPHAVTFDCPAEPCIPNGLNDVWYNYTATCTGRARIETCAPSAAESPDTNLAVYEDCTKCPWGSTLPIDCNGDAFQNCGLGSSVEFGVQLEKCYKIRLSDNLGAPASGNLTVICISDDCQPNGVPDIIEINAGTVPDCNHNGVPDECDIRDGVLEDGNGNGIPDQCEICPSGPMFLLDPPDRVVDARQPQVPGEPEILQGIDTLTAAAFKGARSSCWALCESNLNPPLHPPYPPELAGNAIASVEETQPGWYTLRLKRPITPGEMTTITYRDDLGEVSFVRVSAHPGNVNGDGTAAPTDVLDLIDLINGIVHPVWGLYSADCDHSGLIAPADILCVIDLLNAGWNGTARPSRSGPCP